MLEPCFLHIGQRILSWKIIFILRSIQDSKTKIGKENFMDEQKIKRINALYHKSKGEGLTEEEKAEQKALREEYLAAIRASLRGTLNNISIVEADGSITALSKEN